MSQLTVRELRDLLEQYPDDMQVYIAGYEYGLDELSAQCISVSPVKRDVNEDWWWCGPHERTYGNEDFDDKGLIIDRQSG